jgi:hypothetical protein
VLAEQEKVALDIRYGGAPSAGEGGVFAHGPVPENGDPARKLESFAKELGSRTGAEIALVKFCYVDFRTGSDVKAIFAKYQTTIAALKARHPDTTFVHVTAPVTRVEGGIKAVAKRYLGRTPQDVLENETRAAYNDLLRNAYRDEPVFDLAAVESTYPDGRAEIIELDGRKVQTMVPAYTDDGGHLNREGQLRAARALAAVLAKVPARRAVVPASAR